MFAKILKANPYHDEQGLFTSKPKDDLLKILFGPQGKPKSKGAEKKPDFATVLKGQ